MELSTRSRAAATGTRERLKSRKGGARLLRLPIHERRREGWKRVCMGRFCESARKSEGTSSQRRRTVTNPTATAAKIMRGTPTMCTRLAVMPVLRIVRGGLHPVPAGGDTCAAIRNIYLSLSLHSSTQLSSHHVIHVTVSHSNSHNKIYKWTLLFHYFQLIFL